MNPLNAKPPSTYIEISDSQVKLFASCERRWAYEKLLGVLPKEDRTNLVYGTGVHAGLEKLHLGAGEMESTEACAQAMQKEPGDWDQQIELAKAHVRGYLRHYYPIYSTYWQTVASEEWFEYFIDPVVKSRGSRDNRSVMKTDFDHMAVWDFKTTSHKDGGDLGRTIAVNHQLANYLISYVREHGVWPREAGLIFLQKPKNRDHNDCVNRMLTDPTLYSSKSEPVTPAFANFSIAVEQEMAAAGRRMFALKRLYEQQGVAALDAALPDFNSCYQYGRMCGFAEGCHSCKPVHRVMMGDV